MESYLLHMGKTQMLQAWNTVDFDQYRDILGSAFHDKIKQLYAELEKVDVDTIPDVEHSEFMEYFELIKDWTTLLHYHKTDSFPDELVYSMNLVVREWLDDYQKYVILISDNPYMVTYPSPDLDAKYQNIELRYGIHFEEKIVKICMPIEHCCDYMVNVCLYHEIGHFIDRQRNLTFSVVANVINNVNLNSSFLPFVQKYYPYFTHPFDLSNQSLVDKVVAQTKEYIADLFAAQYCGDGVLMYLKYKHDHEMDKDFEKHPATGLRCDMISDFLNGGNLLLTIITALVDPFYNKRTMFTKKYNSNHMSALGSFNLATITNDLDIHSLFPTGWELYKMDRAVREANYPATKGLSQHELYIKINEVIGKSIAEYAKNNPFA